MLWWFCTTLVEAFVEVNEFMHIYDCDDEESSIFLKGSARQSTLCVQQGQAGDLRCYCYGVLHCCRFLLMHYYSAIVFVGFVSAPNQVTKSEQIADPDNVVCSLIVLCI